MNIRNQTKSVLAIAAVLTMTLTANAGSVSTTTITGETDVVNTGGTLITAVNFGEAPVDINGLIHGAGSGADANLTDNFGFEGDYRNGQSGLGGDMETLLSGIAGANGILMDISGLTVGQDYLFQTYWESNSDQSLTVTFEGTDTLPAIVDQQTGVVIAYEFTAGDDTLNIDVDRDDGITSGDLNNWLSGYSLQTVPAVPEPSTMALWGLLGLSLFGFRRMRTKK